MTPAASSPNAHPAMPTPLVYEIWWIRLAARLHDVGKAAIPAAILNKPGPLDEREWEFMRRHPLIGERIVLSLPRRGPRSDVAASHLA
jgi:HD-GYP domain-containing protein (c-di-GMP phosphodiesterase class II)